EEVVGEIYDEADKDVRSVRVLPDGSRILPGTFPIHDLVDVGIDASDFPRGDYATVAGLVLWILGRIPTEPGDHVYVPGYRCEVTAVAGHTVVEVRMSPQKR
ncbi:HlyC/CorC family transporter, partial [Mycobacterium sp. ITM-2017-0098]